MRVQIKLRNEFVARINTMSDYMTTSVYFHPTVRADESTVKSNKPPIIGVSSKFMTKSSNRPDRPMCMSDFTEMVHAVECVSSKSTDVTEVDVTQGDVIPWDQVRGMFYALDETSHIMVTGRLCDEYVWAYLSIPLVDDNGFISMDEWIIPRIAFNLTSGDRAHGTAGSLYRAVQLMQSCKMSQVHMVDQETGYPCVIRTYVDGNGHTLAIVRVTPKSIKIEHRRYHMWADKHYHVPDLPIKELAEKDSFILKSVYRRGERPYKAIKVNALWSNIIRKDWCYYENTTRS